MIKIRLEEKADFAVVEHLTREAFWNVYCPGCSEHLVLHQLRKDASFVPDLDYVLEEDGNIVAHIAYAKGRVRLEAGGEAEALLFGPVSVLPDCQHGGYGSKIISHTLEKAREMGFPFVVITGNPAYYSRFGFETASKYGIYHESAGREEAPFFMIKIFDRERTEAVKGIYYEPACYYTDEHALEEFDRNFPPKVKEVRPGQLT